MEDIVVNDSVINIIDVKKLQEFLKIRIFKNYYLCFSKSRKLFLGLVLLLFLIFIFYMIVFCFVRCTQPSKTQEYKQVYSDWCHEFEKYKNAMKVWESRQMVSYW